MAKINNISEVKKTVSYTITLIGDREKVEAAFKKISPDFVFKVAFMSKTVFPELKLQLEQKEMLDLDGRKLLLERLSDLLFKIPVKHSKTIFTGHKDFICTYQVKENLSYKSQKVCVSQFFSGKQRQTGMPPRILEALLERKRMLNLKDDHKVIEEICQILIMLEPEDKKLSNFIKNNFETVCKENLYY